jgi:hypothetical protein
MIKKDLLGARMIEKNFGRLEWDAGAGSWTPDGGRKYVALKAILGGAAAFAMMLALFFLLSLWN